MLIQSYKYKFYVEILTLLFLGGLWPVWLCRAQLVPGGASDSLEAARASAQAGYRQFQLGRLGESARLYHQAVQLSPDPLLQAHLRLDLALVLQRLHHLPSALDQVRLARRVVAQAAPRADSTRFLLPRASYIEVDLRLQGIQEYPLPPDSLRRLAHVAEQAAAALGEARVAARRVQALATAAEAWFLARDSVMALARMAQAVALARTLPAPEVLAGVLWKLARLQAATGAREVAEQTLQAVFKATRLPDLQRRCLHLMAYLRLQAGDQTGAEALYRQAVARTQQALAALADPDAASLAFTYWDEAHRGLVRLLLEAGRHEEAFAWLEQVRARSFLPDTTEAPPLSVLQDSLRVRNRVLLSYFLDEADPVLPPPRRSWVVVVTPQQVQAVALEGVSHATLPGQMRQVSPLLLEDVPLTLNTLHLRASGLQVLYALLVRPVEPLLPPDAGLVIVPDGVLFRLPFAALMPDARTYLIARAPVSLALAGRSLLVPVPVLETNVDVVALGKSDFGDVVPPAWLSGGFPALPYVRQELFDLYAGFGCRQVLLGASETRTVGRLGRWPSWLTGCPPLPLTASTEALRTQPIRTRVLHLATHAYGTGQGQAFLVFSPDPASADSDGLIDQEELQAVPWAAQLVVLSACRTGIGAYRGGDGMLGLQAAFHRRGVPVTLSTLWAVDDQAMVDLMSRFYAGLRDGLSTERALQQAQIWYLQHAPVLRRNPYYWAAPVLYGAPAPLTLERRFLLLSRREWLVALGLGVLLVFVLRCRYHYRHGPRT